MNNNHRELTGREKQQIKKLVTSHCANYDREYGCLPLDCECPMFGICYTNSALCKRFRNALLPTAPELTTEEIKRQEQLKRHRIKSRERYQKIKAGEHAVGQPFKLTCKCCGEEFDSKRSNTLFCSPNCRAKFYRQEAAESRSRECVCENCGQAFTTTRSNVKYCCDECRYEGHLKGQRVRNTANRAKKKAAENEQSKTA